MNIIVSLNEALEFISNYTGNGDDLVLPISDLLIDPEGMNMMFIGDALLKKGIMPNGFEQKDGYRNFKYKEMK